MTSGGGGGVAVCDISQPCTVVAKTTWHQHFASHVIVTPGFSWDMVASEPSPMKFSSINSEATDTINKSACLFSVLELQQFCYMME